MKSIQVSEKVHEQLREKKLIKREPYNKVIERLIKLEELRLE